jgi:AraC-like DNA-binding protein
MSEARPLDILSDVLTLLRLRGEVLCWSELGAPWGLSFAPEDALFFHVVERGHGLLRVGRGEWRAIGPGDMVVLPEGRGHRIASARDAKVVPIADLVDPSGRVGERFRHGGGGASTHLLCGRFRFDEVLRRGSLPGLPDVLHVRGDGSSSPEWLGLTVRLLSAEAKNEAPGRDIALARLVDLLFVQTLRHWLAESGDAPLAWIGAARDPRIAAAITLMHRNPEAAWDVASLASKTGMSRSKFAERFVKLVGEPPTRYLTRWRMHFAARLLRGSSITLREVAARVGYDSEAAFNRAFRRTMGTSPGAFR